MNITEAQAAKADLEKAILALLTGFSAHTGLKVERVEVDAISTLSGGLASYAVEVEVQL